MSSEFDQSLLQPQGRVLSTLEADGSRRWLYPRLAKGRFWSRRRAVAYLLIAIFTLIPYLRLNGKPLILLDITARRFTLFGFTFLATDTLLLALFVVSCVLSVFFFTALLGRVWCGWACPQTVYLEFLYRPIERLLSGRTGVGGKPAKGVAGWRVVLKYIAFLAVSMYLAHTFLAYFVGVDALRRWVTQSPAEHPAAFMVMLVTTGLMMFNFSFFREQTCIIACPYGRLQSVLMDKSSLVISYDRRRGEPRGKGADGAQPGAAVHGDCVDCELCSAVCPTGIDIREGLQIECIGCAQCIDACDGVMDKLKRQRGLIRYSSQGAMAGEPAKIIRPRVIIYCGIILTLLSVLTFLLVTKSPLDVTLLRGLGRPFLMTENGEVQNVMRLKMANRGDKPQRLHVAVVNAPFVRVLTTQDPIEIAPEQNYLEPVHLFAPASKFVAGGLNVTLRITGENGLVIDRPCHLLGPGAVATSPASTRADGGVHGQP